ncbi:MAG: hypothetical protein WBM69_18420 [Desulfobacterales bacterium]
MMEYLKKNSNQAGRSRKAEKHSHQDRRWTLMFIGNHGRTITLKRFKSMVILSFTVLVVSIGISAGLFVWNQKIILDNHALKDDLKNLNKRVDTLRYDKDILMTRLVLAESRVQENLSGQTEKSADKKLPNQEPIRSDNDDQINPVAAKKIKLPDPKQAEPQQNSVPIDAGLSVAIENFQISNLPDDNRLRVLFKIKNTTLNSQRVSGYTIVVLKGEQTNWLPIPWMPLVDGRPTGKQRGHSFGINYFKTMSLSTQPPKFPEKFQTASIYVFTREGELLLEKTYPVKLPPNKLKDTEPAPALHAIPAESVPPPLAPTPAPKTAAPPSQDALMETLKDTPPE